VRACASTLSLSQSNNPLSPLYVLVLAMFYKVANGDWIFHEFALTDWVAEEAAAAAAAAGG